jgi:hypothetical protein
MTLDELLGEANLAAQEGALFELPGKQAQELIEELVDYSIHHERFGAVMGFAPGAAPSMGELVVLLEAELFRLRHQGRSVSLQIAEVNHE